MSQIFESILVTRRLMKPEGRALLFIDEIQNSAFAISSLQLFMQDSSSQFAIRFWGSEENASVSVLSSGKKFTLYSLPYYYSGFIEPFLDSRSPAESL